MKKRVAQTLSNSGSTSARKSKKQMVAVGTDPSGLVRVRVRVQLVNKSANNPPLNTNVSAMNTTRTTTSYYTPDLTSTVRKTVRSGAGSAYNNLGHTTDEEDTRGEESERIIFRDTPRSPKDSPIVRLWKRLSGNGDEFKAGPPGTYYDMKVNWWDDIPRLLLIIFSIFFVILAIGYVTTAHPDTLASGAQVVAASTRDMVGFFYQYLIVPSAVLAALAVAVIAVYYTHRYYRNSRAEEEGAFFDLVEKITVRRLEMAGGEEDRMARQRSDRLKAELDMRDKLRPIQPLHVGYCADHSTNEKLIFAMFSTNDQAHKAFTALHGEWYCGRLINVKFAIYCQRLWINQLFLASIRSIWNSIGHLVWKKRFTQRRRSS
ncbi:unnamed protein product, partial [Mesorhabditis spiculigera]